MAKSDIKRNENKMREKKSANNIEEDAKYVVNNDTDHPRMNELRAKVLNYINENEDIFHPDDIELLKTNNFWINRFLNFCNQTFDKAYDHLINLFKQRKETGIRSIDKSMMPMECWLSSTAFIYLPDKKGNPTLYIRVKNHFGVNGKFNCLLKQFLHILIDEIDKLANKEYGFNLFLDLYNMGWKNLDLDMLSYLVQTLRFSYPNGMKYCFVNGLPWFLNIVIKKIVANLPSDISKKVIFVSGSNHDELPLEQVTSNFGKSTDLNNNNLQSIEKNDEKSKKLEIEEYYDLKNLPQFLGGKATLNYKIMPRTATFSICKLGMTNFGYSEVETQRLLQPLKNVINNSQESYKKLKELVLEFEFELDKISNAFARHVRI